MNNVNKNSANINIEKLWSVGIFNDSYAMNSNSRE